MATDYELICAARTDQSESLIHLTRSFDNLLEILRDGYLRPTFAPRKSFRTENTKNTVLGPDPVVCFTEMPLSEIKKLCALPLKTPRYGRYGLIFSKRRLFQMGARPVLYGSSEVSAMLPPALQYLWVGMDLSDETYPTDWSHEREWRFCYRESDWVRFGYPGLPLEYGPSRKPNSTFRIICSSAQEREAINRVLVQQMEPPAGCDPDCFAIYLARLKNGLPQITVLEE